MIQLAKPVITPHFEFVWHKCSDPDIAYDIEMGICRQQSLYRPKSMNQWQSSQMQFRALMKEQIRRAK